MRQEHDRRATPTDLMIDLVSTRQGLADLRRDVTGHDGILVRGEDRDNNGGTGTNRSTRPAPPPARAGSPLLPPAQKLSQ